jgi:hypothetical protein
MSVEVERYNTYILVIRADKLYQASTRDKEGEQITGSQRENGHGDQESELLARQDGREVAWHGQCGFRNAMRDVKTCLV